MDFWSFVRDYAQTITACGVILALFISIFALVSSRKHSKFQTLMEVYKLVNSFEEREARKNVYEAFRIYMEHHYKKGIKIGGKMYLSKNLIKFKGDAFLDIFRDPVVLEQMKTKAIGVQQDVERVRATFDHIGVLYNSCLLYTSPSPRDS